MASTAIDPSHTTAFRTGPTTRVLTVIIIFIVVAILLIIVAEGYTLNSLIQHTSTTLGSAIGIIGIILTIVIFFVLIYVSYVLGQKARTCV